MAGTVGVQGKLGAQAQVPNAASTWKDLADNVNPTASNLTGQAVGGIFWRYWLRCFCCYNDQVLPNASQSVEVWNEFFNSEFFSHVVLFC